MSEQNEEIHFTRSRKGEIVVSPENLLALKRKAPGVTFVVSPRKWKS